MIVIAFLLVFGGGAGVQPHFCPWKNVCFPIFHHGEKWEKKYMEREGKVFISLSFHILFSHFSPWEKWENTHFSMGKSGVGPPCIYRFIYYFNTRKHCCCQGIGGQINLVSPSCYRKTCQ